MPLIPKIPKELGTLEGRKFLERVQRLITRIEGRVRMDGSIIPETLADADAENNSVYFSSTQSKLVYKDGSGVVNDLY